MKRLIFLSCMMLLPVAGLADPLFPNSVASNDHEFIAPEDPTACWTLAAAGTGRTEMYDPRRDTLFVEEAVHFALRLPAQTLRINVHPEVTEPESRASQAAAAFARLPEQMRTEVRYINILDGDGTAWAEDLGRFFTLYEKLMDRRLADRDLDETVFHETAHIALDPILSGDPDWQASQRADGAFITAYAAQNPDREDIAETALFVWTLVFHPGRLPAEVEEKVRRLIPNRVEYMRNMLDGYAPPSCPD